MAKDFLMIPSVRDIKILDKALQVRGEKILLSSMVHIGNLKELSVKCHKANKEVIVNHELVGGLGNDGIAFEMLKNMYKVDIVIGSNPIYINRAKSVGMKAILKVALMDSMSIDVALKMISNVSPETIELRPAICALQYFDIFKRNYKGKIFAGGFIDHAALLDKIFSTGFDGAMTSEKSLWK